MPHLLYRGNNQRKKLETKVTKSVFPLDAIFSVYTIYTFGCNTI